MSELIGDAPRSARDTNPSLAKYLSPAGAWAFALGTSIGWGSLVVTSRTYLAQAGPYGSIIGLFIGMLVMVVIASCYHFLMNRGPSAGGIYAYARDIFGYDHAALVAWFLVLIYAAMFWANATSLQLFARFFLGDLFQFGFHYELFGYDVYLGEALLSIVAIGFAGAICSMFKRGVSKATIAMCGIIVVGITACFAVAMTQRDASAFPFEPKFAPGTSPVAQILSIASISSWAFIGFEGISHSSEEFAFSHRKSFKVLFASLASATLLYTFLTLLSISAYPAQYDSWIAYIQDLSNQSGIAAIPAFFAASYYLGNAGTAILTVVLFCLVLTSLIGNLVALSRLLYAVGSDGLIPAKFTKVNDQGVPIYAVGFFIVVSMVVPFMGRTAIGWIVDVTTLGATLVYGFVSACAIKDGRNHNNQLETTSGVVGLALMVMFGANLLLPAVFSSGAMATESYFIFTVWAVLGFICFRWLLGKDDKRRLGRSIIAWTILLALILFMSAAWMGMIAVAATNEAAQSILASGALAGDPTEIGAFIAQVMDRLSASIGYGAIAIAVLCMFSLTIMLTNYTIVRRREDESHERAGAAHAIANTDPLTGVKSKHAFVTKETELNQRLEAGSLTEFAVVVCDVNGLKQVNDTLGHKAGDEYIRSASKLICECFKHSPVFRIGGDEFVVFLEGADFENRRKIMRDLNKQVERNRDEGQVVVAAGIATFIPEMDKEVHGPFERADALMYQRKIQLKRPGEEVR